MTSFTISQLPSVHVFNTAFNKKPSIKDATFLLPKSTAYNQTTAAAPYSKAEAVVRSPTNMAAAKIAAVDFNKMTSLCRWPVCGHVRWGRSASKSTASDTSSVLIGHKKSSEYLMSVNQTDN